MVVLTLFPFLKSGARLHPGGSRLSAGGDRHRPERQGWCGLDRLPPREGCGILHLRNGIVTRKAETRQRLVSEASRARSGKAERDANSRKGWDATSPMPKCRRADCSRYVVTSGERAAHCPVEEAKAFARPFAKQQNTPLLKASGFLRCRRLPFA